MLDIIDVDTHSRVLCSSRISGLITQSTLVKLSLMTMEEAVELLSHASGLDDVEVSSAVVEVAKLCGRLPLTLNIAASMINDCGSEWEAEVLPELKDVGKFVGDAAGVSVQVPHFTICHFLLNTP
jgi:hypothetical protein